MPDMNAPIKLGANLWNQYTDWPGFLDGMLRAEDLGYDSLFTWDHVYPIVGSWEGPALETYTAMAAVAAQTKRATIGHLVTANTFRNPALLAKMITTIDHISDGRAVLGIGAAWMEPEHTGFGIEFGDRPGTRLRWLEQSLQIIRACSRASDPSSPEGSRYDVEIGAEPAGAACRSASPSSSAARAQGHAAPGGPVRRHEQPRQPHRAAARRRTAILQEHCREARPGREDHRAHRRAAARGHPRHA